MIPYEWVEEAANRIAPFIRHTPLTHDSKNDIYLKWENHQVTGSFKARGAFNKVLSLLPWERQEGLVTASAGNHGQGVALAGNQTGARVTVFASEQAVPNKLDAMRALGAEVILVEGGYGEAENAGLAYAKHSGKTWVSPYNDGQVISGQGTIALEINKDLPHVTPLTWVVPVGGGGLIAGIGGGMKTPGANPPRKLIAVQSEASPFLYNLFKQGSQDGVEELASLADGLSGPVEANSLTIPLAKHYVDEFILVSEDEIVEAIRICWNRYRERIEGSAAVSLAAILSGKIPQRPAVLILTGGNIEAEVFGTIIDDE
jgi:threonine dehydratase